MISRADWMSRPVIGPAVLLGMIAALLACAPLAGAAAPAAAVDQYKPSPPGHPFDLPDEPGPKDGGGSPGTGGGTPSGGGAGGGIAPPAGEPQGGEPSAGPQGEPNGSSPGAGGEGRDGGSGEAAAAADAAGPSVGGYPVTSGIVVALVALAIAIAASLALRAWRRYRGDVAIPRPG